MIFKEKRIFKKAFFLHFYILGIFLLPLFFHISENLQIGPYSFLYFYFLLTLTSLFLFFCLIISYVSFLKKSLDPAYKFLSIFLIASLAFFLLEMGLRIRNSDNFSAYREWGHKKSLFLGFEPRPNHSWKLANASYSTDSHGFRLAPQQSSWQGATGVKIFTVGGSSTFGYGLNDEETWPYLMGHKLGAEFDPALLHVVNAGVCGHNSLQVLFRYYLRVLPLKPQYIIFYENANDFSLNKLPITASLISEDILFSKSVVEYWGKRNKYKNIYIKTLLYKYYSEKIKPRLRREVCFFEKNKENSNDKNKIVDKNDLTSDPVFFDVLQHNGKRYIKNIETLHQICKTNQVQLILVTFIYNNEKISREAGAVLSFYNHQLRIFSQKQKVPLIDLEKNFKKMSQKEKYFSEDHYHPSKEGAKYIAEQITDFMYNMLINNGQKAL